MPRRTEHDDPSAPSILAEENDSGDVRSFEHDAAEAVRNGELSAAQLPGGNGNVDPNEPDAQYPPGIVDNTGAKLNPTDDPSSFVPERKVAPNTGSGVRSTAATPSFTE